MTNGQVTDGPWSKSKDTDQGLGRQNTKKAGNILPGTGTEPEKPIGHVALLSALILTWLFLSLSSLLSKLQNKGRSPPRAAAGHTYLMSCPTLTRKPDRRCGAPMFVLLLG